MRLSSKRPSIVGALALLLTAACSMGPSSTTTLDPRGEGAASGGGDSNGATADSGAIGATTGGSTGSGGASSSGSSGGGATGGGDAGATAPPPGEPPAPGGFQLTIAPLLDAQGCTECHHHGRPIDVTAYPFMAGAPPATAQALVASLTTNMPPAPRTAVSQTVIDQVNAWVAAGMKP